MATNTRSYKGMPVPIKRVNVAGASTATNIAVAGLLAADADAILWIDHISTAASVATIASIDLDEVTVPTAGNIQLSTTTTTSDQLSVVFVDRSL